LEDQHVINELYKASQAGVKIKLIVRGICCLRPGRKGLSENITVRSIVGLFLEHARIFYFHNNTHPRLYGGSADIMVRSFDKRIESLFEIVDEDIKRQVMHILDFNLRDNVNAYELQEDGTYKRVVCSLSSEEPAFDIHQRFFEITEQQYEPISLFDNEVEMIEEASEVEL
jgi:polyphosphate kinase